jgi:hypothetical protein
MDATDGVFAECVEGISLKKLKCASLKVMYTDLKGLKRGKTDSCPAWLITLTSSMLIVQQVMKNKAILSQLIFLAVTSHLRRLIVVSACISYILPWLPIGPRSFNYLLTYDSYGPVHNIFHRGECITWASGGEGALDTPRPLNGIERKINYHSPRDQKWGHAIS